MAINEKITPVIERMQNYSGTTRLRFGSSFPPFPLLAVGNAYYIFNFSLSGATKDCSTSPSLPHLRVPTNQYDETNFAALDAPTSFRDLGGVESSLAVDDEHSVIGISGTVLTGGRSKL